VRSIKERVRGGIKKRMEEIKASHHDLRIMFKELDADGSGQVSV